MRTTGTRKMILGIVVLSALSSCGVVRTLGGGESAAPADFTGNTLDDTANPTDFENNPDNTIWALFNPKTADNTIAVNRYLWTASLEVLNFLPIQTVDPFTGVIVTGFGTPPGGGRAYRATVLVDDPALDARSLNVALQTRGGAAVSKATSRAVEDAILSRARELRIADNRF